MGTLAVWKHVAKTMLPSVLYGAAFVAAIFGVAFVLTSIFPDTHPGVLLGFSMSGVMFAASIKWAYEWARADLKFQQERVERELRRKAERAEWESIMEGNK